MRASFCEKVPTAAFAGKRRKERMKKDVSATGNPVKEGYIIMNMSAVSAEKHAVSMSGRRIFVYKKCESDRIIYVLCKA